MKKQLLCGVCFLLLLAGILKGQDTTPSFDYVIESPVDDEQLLPEIQWILEEGKDILSIEDIINRDYHDARIIDLSQNSNFDIRTATNYWVNFRLSSTLDYDSIGLVIEHIGDCWPYEYTFMSLESFLIDSINHITYGYSGFNFAKPKRDVHELIDPSVINVNIQRGETKNIWLKLMKTESCNMNLQMSLNTYKSLLSTQKINTTSFVNILIYGSVTSFLVLALFIFFWSKDPIYIWFIIFQLSFLLLRICIDFRNEIYVTFFPELPRIFAQIVPLFEAIRYITLLQFGRVFINTRVKFPKPHRLLGYAIIAILILAGIGYLLRAVLESEILSAERGVELNEAWFFIRKFLLLSISLSIIVSLLTFIFSKDKLARVFGIGFFIPVFGNIIRQINQAITHNSSAIDYDLLVSGGMLATMTLALAYRFKFIMLDKETALEEKLVAEQSNSKQLQLINVASNKFVPQKFLNFLGKNNILEASLGDFVEKEVTVLFSDIRDYTALSEGMTPRDTFHFVNEFNKKMGPIITSHFGFINQYLGDGIMAIFPESCDTTLDCAIAMQQRLIEYNLLRIENNQDPVSMGIGLHHGSLIMGIIGDSERLDAATISDTVNVSSRIESLNKQFGTSLLMSHEFYLNLEHKHRYDLRYLGQVSVKGKKNTVGIYEWLNAMEEVRTALKLETIDMFNQALALVESRDYIKAKALFQTILKTNPDDLASQYFYDLCVTNTSR